MIKVGIVGHRFLEQAQTEFVTRECVHLLKHLQSKYGSIVAFSAIAEGADSLFADVALSLQIPVNVVLPFEEYVSDFTNEEARKTYLRLSNGATDIKRLDFSERSEEAYYNAMQWVVVNSDILFAVWNGKASNGKGGTADAVKLALGMGKNWIHLDIISRSVVFHCAAAGKYQNLENWL
jgi:hypothetical protein